MAITKLNPPPTESPIFVQQTRRALPIWVDWFRAVWAILRPGQTVTITTAKLTGGGANGSMVFTNGVLTSSTPAT